MLNQNIYPIHTPIKSSILSHTFLFFSVSGNNMFRLILMNDLTVTPSKNFTCMEHTGMQHTFMSIQLCNANKDNQLEVHKNAARCVN